MLQWSKYAYLIFAGLAVGVAISGLIVTLVFSFGAGKGVSVSPPFPQSSDLFTVASSSTAPIPLVSAVSTTSFITTRDHCCRCPPRATLGSIRTIFLSSGNAVACRYPQPYLRCSSLQVVCAPHGLTARIFALRCRASSAGRAISMVMLPSAPLRLHSVPAVS